jgi:hypothetical protein
MLVWSRLTSLCCSSRAKSTFVPFPSLILNLCSDKRGLQNGNTAGNLISYSTTNNMDELQCTDREQNSRPQYSIGFVHAPETNGPQPAGTWCSLYWLRGTPSAGPAVITPAHWQHAGHAPTAYCSSWHAGSKFQLGRLGVIWGDCVSWIQEVDVWLVTTGCYLM